MEDEEDIEEYNAIESFRIREDFMLAFIKNPSLRQHHLETLGKTIMNIHGPQVPGIIEPLNKEEIETLQWLTDPNTSDLEWLYYKYAFWFFMLAHVPPFLRYWIHGDGVVQTPIADRGRFADFVRSTLAHKCELLLSNPRGTAKFVGIEGFAHDCIIDYFVTVGFAVPAPIGQLVEKNLLEGKERQKRRSENLPLFAHRN